MKKPCNCTACVNDKDCTNPSWFKENTLKISKTIEEILEKTSPLGKNNKNIRNFCVTLSDFNDSDGSVADYSKDITQEEFIFLLNNLFDIQIDDFDDFDDENEIMVFKNIDEAIDFLKDEKEKDQ